MEARWLDITEAGGDGIAGARAADRATASAGDLLRSPSFWIALLLLPIVYLLVLSLIGVVGTVTWSDEVRAGQAGSLISAIIGGLVGYYYGQTTSRNRTPAAGSAD